MISFLVYLQKKRPDFTGTIHFCDFIRTASKAENGRQKSTNSREESKTYMISKKKFGTTVTAFGVAAGMLLGSAAPAHAEETAKTVQETQKDQAAAPATQSETENGNTEEAVVTAVETQEAAEAGKF